MEAGGRGTTSKPIKNRFVVVVCFAFDLISRLNFPSRRILCAICLKSTFSGKLGEGGERERNNFSETFSYCSCLSFKKSCELKRWKLSPASGLCSPLCSHFRTCPEGEQGCSQPMDSPPVTSAFQSRALQEIRCDGALRLFIFLPAIPMRQICFHSFELGRKHFEASFSDP